MSDGIAFPNRFNAWTLSASFSTQTMTTKMKIIVSTLILGLAITSVGLLQKTTHKQSKKMETADSTHSEEWEFYFKNLDNKVASIYVDLGFHKIAPIKDQPNVVWVSIKMNNPSEDGLSSNKESNQLFKIEDALVDKLKARFNSIYVGRVTSTGIRKLYFYFGDTLNYNKVISEAISIFPKYHFDFGSKEDKEWINYLDSLYPNPRQFQRITNRRVVEQLEKGGDKLIKAREVDHWLYFKAEKDRETFLLRIKEEGFSIVDKDFDQSLGISPYRLHIKRVDKVDLESVDIYVIHLWELATECNGEYDGWETSVEKK